MLDAAVSSQPTTFLHDGTFEGFLECVFEAMATHRHSARIDASSHHQAGLFETMRTPQPCPEHAERVWKGIVQQAGKDIAAMVRTAFLAEQPGLDDSLWFYLRSLFTDPSSARNVLDEHAHAVFQAAQKVRHEAHLFQGFVRFSQAPDGSMFAVIAPTHDILALLGPHFQSRFPGTLWLIADSRRGLCLHSNGKRLELARCDPTSLPKDAGEVSHLADPEDARFQALWRCFYNAVNITERKNSQQMTRLLPRKYWQYLPERTR